MKGWLSDLVLGVRLAMGGGRTSWARLTLTGLGIGLGIVVLLAASSVPTMLAARAERSAAGQPVTAQTTQPTSDVLYVKDWMSSYYGRPIAGDFVLASGPGAPVPPGVSKVPGDGEIALSPELARLLDSPEGELLRERFPQRRVELITQAGLNSPRDLVFVAGDATVQRDDEQAVVSFGGELRERGLDPVLSLLIMVGVVALLFPVLVFVGISARLAGAERDRRLAALRLVGAGAQRVRRIAAGEALLGAVTGMVIGAGLFLVARQFVERLELMGISVFVSDLTPTPPLTALIAVLVPVLAVVTSLISMRRTVVEPLGVVRRAKPVRRVMWWRTVPVFVGTAALWSQSGLLAGSEHQASEPVVVGGILLLLLSIPLLLPWVVERAVGRLRGGAPSWQLAIRRLQVDSGTAARVVGGVSVVLAGAIAVQSVLVSAEHKIVDRPVDTADRSRTVVQLTDWSEENLEQTVGLLSRAVDPARVHPLLGMQFEFDEDNAFGASVGSCETLKTQATLDGCADGDAFYVTSAAGDDADRRAKLRPGSTVTLTKGHHEDRVVGSRWTIPDYRVVQPPEQADGYADPGLLLTPGALRGVDVEYGYGSIRVDVDPDDPAMVEELGNAIAPLTWRVYTYYYGRTEVAEQVQAFQSVRQGLLAGSLLTLLLAGASLLILALEQVRERRRPLAVLAASGVPRGALSRSLLWQNAVPLVLALVVAVAIGSGLGVLLLRIVEQPIVVDWASVGILSGTSLLLVILVTALTLPAMRRATGALGLRSE
ncbi:FtsX-like permease family protein [Actinosynnema sp. NPDC023587]|uniref:FtsX-like permease family protein n=1 Tax=Actinosynnema sp. NPDC023587 TaxID=3154695 RepID=UPI0033C64BD5